jgi:predicted ester cyclase
VWRRIRQFIAGWADAVPDGKIEVLNALGGVDGAAMQCRFRGTNSGPIVGPGGTIPPSGRPVDLRFCEIYTIRDGQIIRMANYQDAADFLRQIGLMPEPQQAGA